MPHTVQWASFKKKLQQSDTSYLFPALRPGSAAAVVVTDSTETRRAQDRKNAKSKKGSTNTLMQLLMTLKE